MHMCICTQIYAYMYMPVLIYLKVFDFSISFFPYTAGDVSTSG